MKVKTTLFFILFTFALSLICAKKRPNILYLYVDDLGWGSIGPNGQYERKEKGLPYVLTPNLDKLAEEGINFTRGYGCTVCSPPVPRSKLVSIKAIHLPIVTTRTMRRKQSVQKI